MLLIAMLAVIPTKANEQQASKDTLSIKEVAFVRISATAAAGNLTQLETEIAQGLDSGLTINQIKESLIQLYAYAGFPRSLRALQTMIIVLENRNKNGIIDVEGPDATAIVSTESKYNKGKNNLEILTGISEDGPKKGYAQFAPTIEIFLKEHLFASIFDRDVLTFAERELITISILASMTAVEPMLKSHLTICLHNGFTIAQLEDFVQQIKQVAGLEASISTQKILKEILLTQ